MTRTPNQIIGRNLRRIRKDILQLNQAQLATVLGVSQSQVSEYEIGRDMIPAARLLQLVKQYPNISVAAFFDEGHRHAHHSGPGVAAPAQADYDTGLPARHRQVHWKHLREAFVAIEDPVIQRALTELAVAHVQLQDRKTS